ncbi:winged helix DNA-binding domain-containing protein, partial [Candidatus Bipolaricaulota bacterium]|nr:winged helix DNA-binding domain-containing protein [Candidatus Bipolaricaulota bacterium]
MPKSSLSLAQARRIAIASQCLAPSIEAPGKSGVASAIEHLGYVQIDTISVIARAHHHTLWQRCPDYDPAFLNDLMAVDRRVFEYWAHAIAYLPISDYRYYIPRMNRHRTNPHAWLGQWKKDHASVLEQVLQRIRSEGALASKDFIPPPGTKRGTWWDWKPAKRALEILFWQGDLMISERRGFQKFYDLTERVLPPTTDTTVPSSEELSCFHVFRALTGLGVARAKEIREVFHIADLKSVSKTLLQMTKSKEVVPVSIEGLDDIYYVLPKSLEDPCESPSQHAYILSPFDNLTIQRERM